MPHAIRLTIKSLNCPLPANRGIVSPLIHHDEKPTLNHSGSCNTNVHSPQPHNDSRPVHRRCSHHHQPTSTSQAYTIKREPCRAPLTQLQPSCLSRRSRRLSPSTSPSKPLRTFSMHAIHHMHMSHPQNTTRPLLLKYHSILRSLRPPVLQSPISCISNRSRSPHNLIRHLHICFPHLTDLNFPFASNNCYCYICIIRWRPKATLPVCMSFKLKCCNM